jgi:cytoskeletal protein RodZ
MKSIGILVKEVRTKKKLSKESLETKTKIKVEYIDALEKEDWSRLPEYPVVVGFVKNIAATLSIDDSLAVALLRRDYPPKSLTVNPKPDVGRQFTWGPRLTFITAVGVLLFCIFIYLISQYIHFVRPPELVIETPQENQLVSDRKFIVKGKTDPEATITVNNQPTLVEENGKFTAEIEIAENTNEIIIDAKSRAGKETILSRKIKVDFSSKQ